jgi:hypothetical protein
MHYKQPAGLQLLRITTQLRPKRYRKHLFSRLGEPNTQTDTKGDSKDNKNNNQQAVPLVTASASSMLICLLNFGITLIDILGSLHGILLSVLNYGILGLYDLSHIREHGRKLGESSLDSLKLIVTGANCTEH